MTVGALEAVGTVMPIESEAMDEGVKGDTPPMAEDVRKEEVLASVPAQK